MKNRVILTLSLLLLSLCCPSAAWCQLVAVDKPEFRSVYNLAMQCPEQVEYVLHSYDIGNVKREPAWLFVNDVRDPRAVSTHYDYNQSGFDRGHLCPAQDRSFALTAMKATFGMSNICPQVPSVNRGSWKRTEIACRQLAQRHDSITIVVVPLFLKRDTTYIGRHHLAVPHAFIKAAWLPASDEVVGCWLVFNHK